MSFLPLQNIFRIFLWMGFNCFKSAEQIREGEGGGGGWGKQRLLQAISATGYW